MKAIVILKAIVAATAIVKAIAIATAIVIAIVIAKTITIKKAQAKVPMFQRRTKEEEEEVAEEARALTVTGIVCSHVGVTGLHRSPV